MVFSRNPEREARLLREWANGTTSREASARTSVPEGTVYYYWKKFNKDPEKANRLAKGLVASDEQIMTEILVQNDDEETAKNFQDKYDDLIRQGKYAEAEAFAKAEQEKRRYLRQLLRGAGSLSEYDLRQADQTLKEIEERKKKKQKTDSIKQESMSSPPGFFSPNAKVAK